MEEKKEKPKADVSKKDKRTLNDIIGEYKGEFQKIIWLSKEDLIKQTFTVIVTSLMVGAIIASMDYVFTFMYKIFVGFFI